MPPKSPSPNLPDPLEPAAAAAPANPDDLLSQLAGDEIDRLLAEADVDSSSAPAVEAVAQPVAEPAVATTAEPAPVPSEIPAARTAEASPTPTTPPLDTQLDDLFKALNEPSAEPADDTAPAAAESVPSQPAPTATDLDNQLAKLADELLPEPAAEQALTPVDAIPAAMGAAQMEAAVPVAAGDERAVLLADGAAEPETLAVQEGLLDDAPLAWYLRPLLWLNAPFAALTDSSRSFVGKAALATLLFSITLLTYIAITRHRL